MTQEVCVTIEISDLFQRSSTYDNLPLDVYVGVFRSFSKFMTFEAIIFNKWNIDKWNASPKSPKTIACLLQACLYVTR